jgi:hypothetical protein
MLWTGCIHPVSNRANAAQPSKGEGKGIAVTTFVNAASHEARFNGTWLSPSNKGKSA